MATSSRQSALFGVQDWKKIYQTFREADFQSYDYETLRKSFIDYLRVYYPETFNDYTESSEFIALLDIIAFMGQALAFRDDLNTRENFIDTAERRDSVIKLANLVSYNPKRNNAAQGWMKVTGISTTENVYDITNNNLSNTVILWNDPANVNWQEQFNAIINAALVNSQKVGRPGNSQNILGVNTDEYSINLPVSSTPVYPFTATVNGTSMDFELVSITSVNSSNVYEIPPQPTSIFNMAYRNDKLGYGSPNTGFFFYFKQGSLQTSEFQFAQKINNRVQDINVLGINNTDTWLYQLNSNGTISTIWEYSENIYGDSTLRAAGSNKKIFSVISRNNDQVSYVFGDGVFAEVPVGSYRAYFRSGNALTYVIDPTEFQGTQVTIPYVSRSNRVETLTINLELTKPVTTAQTRESLVSIKERAPSRYYTQNRMVNGEDYSNFPYTLYNSIIKSTAINRTSVGVSRNLDLLDPSGKYSSTNNFGTDGALWQDDEPGSVSFLATSSNEATAFVTDGLKAFLSQYDTVQYYDSYYPRYPGNYPLGSVDDSVYWESLTNNADAHTGYFYIKVAVPNTNPVQIQKQPIPIGNYSAYNMKYLTPGAMFKLVPQGNTFYFNEYNQQVFGTPKASTDKTYFWATITQVIGDGCNNGEGAFANGSGPVTVNTYIPSGARIDPFRTQDPDPDHDGFTNVYRTRYGIIPSFQNTLPTIIYTAMVQRIMLDKSFVLLFDNSLLATQDRWSLLDYTTDVPARWYVNFIAQGGGKYVVIYRTLNFYFGSVDQTRFYFDGNKKVFDPVSGKLLHDFVNILATNTQPMGNNRPLQYDVTMNIIAQKLEADGYVNDFEVEVSGLDNNLDGVIDDPDFFTYVTGYNYNTDADNTGIYVFFERITDILNLSRLALLPADFVNYQYPTLSAVQAVIYQYNVGQVFYTYQAAGQFFQTIVKPGSTSNELQLVDVSQLYTVAYGRGALQYQYRHNSPNTARIDPGTTNIIDLYVVTQAYYTAYQNWINDSTNTVPKPLEPTTNELQDAYSQLDQYKMISDDVILNSVTFKPLFGTKAAPQLQGSIKVIKGVLTTASDSEIRSAVVASLNSYFTLDKWNFGETFFFSELSAYLHVSLGDLISSVVLVPANPSSPFGDLYEVRSAPYEIFVNGATTKDIQVIAALTPAELQISGY